MAVIGRNFRPVVHNERCNTCSVCTGQCPAYVDEGFRNDRGSIRGKVFQTFAFPPPVMPTPIEESPPPCQVTCPIHQDVRGYIRAVAQKRYSDAVALIRQANPLPLVCGYICPHPCEMECFRGSIDDPVAIRAVKRFVALFEKEEKLKPDPLNITSTKKVAIVGSGPAGIAAAYKLIQNGVKSIIFEKTSHIGGMLSWAIPDFRLPRDILKYEISVLKGLGIEFKTHQSLGNNLTISSLKERGFEAIILAIGTTQGKKVELEGAKDFKAHLDCLKILSLVSQGAKTELGKSVAVIGGGNAAIDTARVLKRSGVDQVTVVYRRPEGQMPADNEEVMEAKSEGILFRFSSLPTALSKNNGHWNLSGFETKSPGRHLPVEVLKDKPFSLPITGIISAISQVPETPWAQTEGIVLNPDGTLQVDDAKTSVTGVYGAGDAITGPSTVVEAMASGYTAAEAVLKFLHGDKQN